MSGRNYYYRQLAKKRSAEAEAWRVDPHCDLSILSSREREVFTLYFGCEEGQALGMNEIGSRVGLTNNLAHIVLKRAVTKLRRPQRS